MNRLWQLLDANWKEYFEKVRPQWGISILKIIYWTLFPWLTFWVKLQNPLNLRKSDKSGWDNPKDNDSIPEYFQEPDESPVQAARKQY